jgi:hypothetical protein
MLAVSPLADRLIISHERPPKEQNPRVKKERNIVGDSQGKVLDD